MGRFGKFGVAVLTVAVTGGLAFADPGDLDTAFGNAGKKTTDFPNLEDDLGRAVAVAPDGKLVVAGDSGIEAPDGPFNFALARYGRNGRLDDTFGGDGRVTTDFFGNVDRSFDVKILPSGKILVAGRAEDDTGRDRFAVARYRPDGGLDDGFGGGDGRVTTKFGEFAGGSEIQVLGDGSFVVGGTSYTGENGDFALARYHPGGRLDRSFGNEGKRRTDFGVEDEITDVAKQDGKLLAAGLGSPEPFTGYDVATARYTMDGQLDDGFGGGDGKKLTPLSDHDDFATGLVVRSDDRFVVSVNWEEDAAKDFALARFRPNGGLDDSFGDGDGVEITPRPGDEVAWDVVAFGRRLLIGGQVGPNMGVGAYRRNGNVALGFGSGGGLAIAEFATESTGSDVAIQDGKLVEVGWTKAEDKDFALARFLLD